MVVWDIDGTYIFSLQWCRNIHREEESHTNVTENDCTAASDRRKYTTAPSKTALCAKE